MGRRSLVLARVRRHERVTLRGAPTRLCASFFGCSLSALPAGRCGYRLLAGRRPRDDRYFVTVVRAVIGGAGESPLAGQLGRLVTGRRKADFCPPGISMGGGRLGELYSV